MSRALFDRNGALARPVLRELRRTKRLVLLLDFDGTLAPIRRIPSVASLPRNTEALLRRLCGHPSIAVALVTGRSHADIVRKVSLRNVVFISNHGFQMTSGRRHWIHPAARKSRPLIASCSRRLKRSLQGVRGVLIENKALTLTVHFRNTPVAERKTLFRRFDELVSPHLRSMIVTTGKKVLEIRPGATWGKGDAVLRLLRSLGESPSRCVVYVGDDATDEDAFRKLPLPAVTIRVGKTRMTSAVYHATSTNQVRRFLEIVHSIKTEGARE